MRGIRASLDWHDDPVNRWADRPDYLTDPSFRRGFRMLGRYKLSFDCQLYPAQMADLASLADLAPETPVIVLHAGMPADRSPEGLTAWRSGLAELARRKNVSIKFCGLSMIVHNWTAAIMRDYALTLIDIFGPGRVMFASNFPVDRPKGSFDAYFDAYALAVEGFSTQDQRALFQDNAARIYRLG